MKKNNETLNHIASTRQRLGMTQEQMAAYAGVSRTLIAMAETNRRSVPTKVLVKLASLEIEFEGHSIIEKSRERHSSEMQHSNDHASAAHVYFRKATCEQQAFVLSEKLANMEERYNKLRSSLECIEQILKLQTTVTLPATDEINETIDGRSRLFYPGFLESQRDNILRRMKNHSLVSQSLLRNRIALLHAEAGLHESIRQQFLSEPV